MTLNISTGDSGADFVLPFDLPPTSDIILEAQDTDFEAREKLILEKSWLHKGHPIGDIGIDVDLNLLAVLDGDSFIKKTPFEGYGTQDSLKYFSTFTDKLLEKADFLGSHKTKVEHFRDEMKESLEIAKKIDNIIDEGSLESEETQEKLINDYAEELLIKFNGNKRGWFPFGWTTKNGEPHAMMAYIDMEKGKVTIVNAGAGLEYHHKIECTSLDKLTGEIKTELKYQQFLTISDLDKNRLNHVEFFKFILKVQILGAWEGSLEVDQKNLYETLPGYLKGSIEPALDPFNHPEAFKKGQRAGTCNIQSKSTTLYYMLADAFDGDFSSSDWLHCYKKIKYLWQTQGLTAYCQKNLQEERSINDSEVSLLRDITSNLSRAAEKLHQDNLLTEEDLDEAQATFMDIEDRLENAKILVTQIEKPEPLSCNLDSALPEIALGEFIDPTKCMMEEGRECDYINSQMEIPTKEKPLYSKTYGEIHERYGRVYQKIKSMDSLTKAAIRQDLLTDFARMSINEPGPSNDPDSFWNTIPEDEIADAIQNNYHQMVLLQNIHFLDGQEAYEADVTVMLYNLYAINIQLARRLKETQLDGFNINYYDLIYEMKSPHFIIKNPLLQKKLDELLKFFDPAFNLEKLTRIENTEILKKHENSLFAFKEYKYFEETSNNCVGYERIIGTDETMGENQTLQYLKNFLENSELKKLYGTEFKVWYRDKNNKSFLRAVNEQDPILARLQVLWHCQNVKDILPKAISNLLKSAMLCQFHHYRKKDEGNTSPVQINGDFSLSSCIEQGIKDRLFLEYNLHGFQRCKINDRSDVQGAKLKQALNTLDKKDLRLKQNNVMSGQKHFFGLDLDSSRELQMIGIDPYGEAARAISFAQRHLHLLKEKQFQDLLSYHLLGYGKLISQLEDQPKFISNINTFLKDALKKFQDNGDLDTCLFIAKLGEDLQNLISLEDYEEELLNSRNILREEVLTQFGSSSANKEKIFATLLSFYEHATTKDLEESPELLNCVASDLLSYKIAKRLNTLENGSSDRNSVAEIVQKRLQYQVSEFMEEESDERNRILNDLAWLANPSYTDLWAEQEWKFSNINIYESESHIIDLSQGSVIDKNQGGVMLLPQKILDNEQFKKIFQGKIETCKVRENAVGNLHTANLLQKNLSFYEHPKDEKMINLLKEKIEECKKNPSRGHIFIINENLPNAIKISVLGKSIEFQKEINGKKYTYDGKPEFLKQAFHLNDFDNYHCWLNTEDDHPHYIIEKDNTPLYKAELTRFFINENELFKIKNIKKTDSQGRLLQWVPRNDVKEHEDFHLSIVQALAASDVTNSAAYEMRYWAFEETQELAELSLPKFGLSFASKGKEANKRLVCEQYPGYHLVKSPEISLLSGLPYFTLSNMAGECKVIVPKAPIKVAYRNDFSRKCTQELDFDKPISFVEFDLTEGELHAKSIENQFYRVLLFAARGHYEQALEALDRISGLGRFKNSDTLNWLEALLRTDKHPASQALYLRLAVKGRENMLKYPLSVKEVEENLDIDSIEKVYDSYRNNCNNAPQFRLSGKQLATLHKMLDPDPNAYVKKLGVRIIRSINLKDKDNAPTLPTIEELRQYFSLEFKIPTEKFNLLSPFSIKDDEFFAKSFAYLYKIALSDQLEEKEALMKLLELNSNLQSMHLKILKEVCSYPNRFPTFKEITDAEENYLKEKEKDKNSQKTIEKKTKLEICLKKIVTTREIGHIEIISNIFKDTLGGFNFATNVRNEIYSWFQKDYKPKAESHGNTSTPININGMPLKEVDLAFDDYFKTLVKDHFNKEKIDVCHYWEDNEDFDLPVDHPDKNVRKKLEAERKDLEKYRKKIPKQIKFYTVKAETSIKALETELRNTHESLSTRLKTERAAILWQVNQISPQASDIILKGIHMRGQQKKLNWEDIKALTLSGSMEKFKERTLLGDEEILKLTAAVSDHLLKTTRLDQISTVLKAIEKVEKEEKDGPKMEMLIQNVASSLKIVRAYDPDASNIQRQWFEVTNHYHYRKKQLKKIDKLIASNKNEVLAEMPTGYGKTKTVVPSLNYEMALKNYLVINTWPKSLEMTNTLDVKDQMESFGKKVDLFIFDRSTNMTLESLRFLYEEFIRNEQEGIPINICSESFRSLELHFLMTLKEAATPDIAEELFKELKEKIGLYIKLLREIRTNGWTTIDEPHIILDSMDKLIYTLGNFDTMHDDEVGLCEELFRVLCEEPFSDLLGLRENRQHMASAIGDDEKFEEEVALPLAKHFMKWLNLDAEDKQSFNEFVLGKNNNKPEWIEKHPKKELIALLKGQLTQVLKSSLKGSIDKTFGLSKLHIQTKEFAVPYAGSNTPKETESNPSQFKNHHETLNKTYLTYLHKPLQHSQVKKLIDFLRKKATEQTKEGKDLEDTEVHKIFRKIVADENKKLMHLTDHEISQLSQSIGKNPDAIFYYVRNIIVPQIKIYPEILISTVQNFRSQFASSLSLGATPQVPAAHGPNTQFIPMKGTSGQVTHLLLTKCHNPNTLHKLEAIFPKDVLAETNDLQINNPKIHAVMDIGALYKGLSNHQVAEEMRAKLKDTDTQAIMFFDEAEQQYKIMNMDNGLVQGSSEMEIDEEDRSTYYDENQCYGRDITQAIDTIGLLLSGRETTKASVAQGGGRMRQWDQQQSVEIAYQQNYSEEIFGNEDPNIKKLLTYWIANQTKEEQESIYQSQLQQMENEKRRSILDKILGLQIDDTSIRPQGEPDVDNAISIFNQIQDELFDAQNISSWSMYAGIPEEKDTVECLTEANEAIVKIVEGLNIFSSREKQWITAKLNAYPSKWEDMALPKKVRSLNTGLGMECEVLQEVEVNVEAKAKEEIKVREPMNWEENKDLFNDDWLHSGGILPEKWHRKFVRFDYKLMNGVRDISSSVRNGIEDASRTCEEHLPEVISAIAIGILKGLGLLLAVLAAPPALAYFFVRQFFIEGSVSHRINELMDQQNINGGPQFFNSKLIASENFYSQGSFSFSRTQVPQTPFDAEQKPLFEVLVIEDTKENGKKKLKMMAIDQNDSVYFRRKMKEDNEKTTEEIAQTRKRKIAMYDIHNRMIAAQGKNGFDTDELESNENFQGLLAEARFLNGEINFTAEELAHIKAKADAVGGEKVAKLYNNYALKNRPLNKAFAKEKEIATILPLEAL